MLAVTYPLASASSFVTTAGDATPLWEDVTDPTCSGDRHRASASSYLSSQSLADSLPPPKRKKERKQTTQGRDGRTVHRHHTGIF